MEKPIANRKFRKAMASICKKINNAIEIFRKSTIGWGIKKYFIFLWHKNYFRQL